MHISKLPVSFLRQMFSYLDHSEQWRVSGLCKAFRAAFTAYRGTDDIKALAGKTITLEKGISEVYFATALFWGLKEGLTPVEIAARLGQEAFKTAYEKGHNRFLDVGSTLLHGANTAAEVKFLTKAGQDVNAKDNWSQTPLWVAICQDEINVEVVKELLDQGADVTICDHELFQTPLLRAIERKAPLEVISLLIKAGADPTRKEGWREETAIEVAEELYPEALPILTKDLKLL